MDVGKYTIDPEARLPLVIRVSQGDTGRKLEFVKADGTDFVGVCQMAGLKPSGSAFYGGVALNAGATLYMTLTEDMTDEPGDVLCEIVQNGSGGAVYRRGTPNFVLRVEKTP